LKHLKSAVKIQLTTGSVINMQSKFFIIICE
jgi:hypothetical protein